MAVGLRESVPRRSHPDPNLLPSSARREAKEHGDCRLGGVAGGKADRLVGIELAVGVAAVVLARTRRGSRIARISGWTGAVGVVVACAGGLLTEPHPLRLAGMGLMLLGTIVAGFDYLLPSLERLERASGA